MSRIEVASHLYFQGLLSGVNVIGKGVMVKGLAMKGQVRDRHLRHARVTFDSVAGGHS